MKKFTIGTRGSLLALTQTDLIKTQLEKLHDVEFDVKIIKTRGDEQTQKPLWQLDGKDFFTRELDEALLKEEVDLVVHSYKDLGSERPAGIEIGTIPPRTFPNDILLIKKSTVAELKKNNLRQFIVGTSSPRRIVQIQAHLSKIIPTGEQLELKCEILRGNVNTRIEKLINGQYQAIVLAFAGLERLALHPKSHDVLKKLCQDLTFAILPPSKFTPAPAQGALAIEINKNAKNYRELKTILKSIHHHPTATLVAWEKAEFKNYGGGCHLAMGIHARSVKDQVIYYKKGEVDGKKVSYHETKDNHLSEKLATITNPREVFLGMKSTSQIDYFQYDELSEQIPLTKFSHTDAKHLYVTSRYCLSALSQINPKEDVIISTAGVKTWQQLAQANFWVNLCTDGLGEEELQHFCGSKLLTSIFEMKSFVTMTHDKSEFYEPMIAAYQRTFKTPTAQQLEQLKQVQVFFWTSFDQYQHYQSFLPDFKNKIHLCGAGKTYEQFVTRNIPIEICIDLKSLKNKIERK